ncbi:hypothetical protein I3843_01G144500 [Carya illinoinensis]|nr:hypothetical protein I3843_01G144500 [Carya illinoinensis]
MLEMCSQQGGPHDARHGRFLPYFSSPPFRHGYHQIINHLFHLPPQSFFICFVFLITIIFLRQPNPIFILISDSFNYPLNRRLRCSIIQLGLWWLKVVRS